MKFKYILFFFSLFFILFNTGFAGIIFSEIFPNTDDDSNLEYIELYNSGNIERSLSGFFIQDKSIKTYKFGSGEFIGSGQLRKFFRTQTKIILNNTGDDLFLYDNSGSLVDSFSYDSTQKGEIIKIIDLGFTNTGSLSGSGNLEDTLISSGSLSLSGNLEDNFELIFSFQNPSYIIDKEKNLDTYICDNSKDICKINLDLRNSFTGSFSESDFDCEIDFGFNGWYNGQENKCNPSTIIYPKGEFNLSFKIIPKDNTSLSFTGGFLLQNIVEPEIIEIIKQEKKSCSSNSSGSSNNKTDDTDGKNVENINISKPEIIIQSGLDENNKCKKEECNINLKYEEKQNGEKCVWNFDGGIFDSKTAFKCNPGYVKYGIGNYEINLKVYQENNENNFSINSINISNIKEYEKKQENKSNNFENYSYNETNKTEILNESEDIKEEKKIEIIYDFSNLKIDNIMPNPKGSDDFEYFELKNTGKENINLKGCFVDDILDGGSFKHIFDTDIFIKSGSKIRFYKDQVGINFNNNLDEINLFCNGYLIDNLTWNFSVKAGYNLTHDILDIKGGKAKVIRAIDGDTIEVEILKNSKKVILRLIGLDTPELKNYKGTSEYYSKEAFDFTKLSLENKIIFIEVDKNNFRDKYGRLLGFVFLEGKNFNLELLNKGYAKSYLNYDFKYINEFKKAEKSAKNKKIGIWVSSNKKHFDKISFNKNLKYSNEINLNSNIKSIIEVQGKVGSNKSLSGNILTCIGTCSVNLDGSNSIGNGLNYFWDFGNGETFEGKNPGYIRYEIYGKYKINFRVVDSFGNENISSFFVNFIPKPKKAKNNKTKVSSKSIDSKENNIKKVQIYDKKESIEKKENNNGVFYYFLILLFISSLIFILLKKEKII